MDETWIHHYDPETKEQSKEWKHAGSPRPKKFLVQKSAGTVFASLFWDKDGIIMSDYLEQGKTVTGALFYIINEASRKNCGETPWKIIQRCTFLARQCSRSQVFDCDAEN